MRLLDAVKESSDFLKRSGIEDPLVDAELLCLHAAGMDRLQAFLDNPEIGKDLLRKIRTLARRRAKGEPLQYITGDVDFLGLRIEVGRGVLIPRPETELVVQEAIKTIRGRIGVTPPLQILDLCTGTGCIALALAREFPDAIVYGTDISRVALRYAEKNLKINGISNIEFRQGRLYEPVKGINRFDLIISNPPYIRSSDIKDLQREIRDWEPAKALDGGEEGLDYYRKIFADAADYLAKDGYIIVELGFGQARSVEKIAMKAGFEKIEITKDYAGIERILKAAQKK